MDRPPVAPPSSEGAGADRDEHPRPIARIEGGVQLPACARRPGRRIVARPGARSVTRRRWCQQCGVFRPAWAVSDRSGTVRTRRARGAACVGLVSQGLPRTELVSAHHVFPPSLERWMICPNQPLDCDAKSVKSAGDLEVVSQPPKVRMTSTSAARHQTSARRLPCVYYQHHAAHLRLLTADGPSRSRTQRYPSHYIVDRACRNRHTVTKNDRPRCRAELCARAEPVSRPFQGREPAISSTSEGQRRGVPTNTRRLDHHGPTSGCSPLHTGEGPNAVAPARHNRSPSPWREPPHARTMAAFGALSRIAGHNVFPSADQAKNCRCAAAESMSVSPTGRRRS